MTDANPYEAPSAASGPAIEAPTWDGARLAFDARQRLPRVCLKCGVTEGVQWRAQTFLWVPPVAYFALLFGVLPALVVIAVVRRRAKPSLPMCAKCRDAFERAQLNIQLVAMGIAFGVIAVLGFVFNGMPFVGGVVAIVVGVPSVLGIKRLNARMLAVARIDGTRVRLKGVCEKAGREAAGAA